MNIFEALREDHEIQRDLVKRLIETSGDQDARDELFIALRSELESHAEAEERHFYVPLIESDLTQEKARHSIAEHHEIDELIEELENTEYSSPGWLVTAKKLQEKVEHHLSEEEHEVFQMAGKVLSAKQKEDLAKSYRKYMADSR
ncbi:hemerythrin domain-containing protein [Zeaxanthinibacter enoshimensis]|uniref:Hemerythrin HHE cation binding domain-containing protein n=1 Tax=Zeaxanthinibacter enoshimensis TaxID=392009 RepID=A0A4R6TSD1_9FLAO|nr:hemerythrin domain-containing protein [Zeaxanthinibacter enoshimensis]TDQ33237.1 hemerythrin HHE cation binding domain-containing protein [Zeaxanthinibacter enoshimensis]